MYSLHFSNFLWEEKGLCYLIYCMLHTLGHGLYLSLSSFLQHLASYTVYMPHQSKGIKLDFLSSCFCHFRTPDKMWGRTLWLRAVFTSACMNSSKNIFKTSLFTLLAAAATIRPSSMVNWTFDQSVGLQCAQSFCTWINMRLSSYCYFWTSRVLTHTIS